VTSKKFFFVLRRVNAVVILIAGALGCAALATVLYMMVQEALRHRHVQDVLNVTGTRAKTTETSLGDFAAITGSAVVRASLDVEQEYSLGSGSKEAHSIRNYLFFDPLSDQSYWLIPEFKGIIPTTTELPSVTDEPVKAVVYELIEEDSNHDGQLTCADLKDIAISDAAGKHFTRALKGVARSYGTHLMPDSNEVVVIYTSGGSQQAAHIEIATGKVLRTAELAPSKPLLASESAQPRCGDGAY